MTVGNISRSNLHERMLPTRRGSNPQPPNHQSDAHLTKPRSRLIMVNCLRDTMYFSIGLLYEISRDWRLLFPLR